MGSTPFVLSQSPLLVPFGSLFDQLKYPFIHQQESVEVTKEKDPFKRLVESEQSESRQDLTLLHSVLERVELTHLLTRVSVPLYTNPNSSESMYLSDWTSALSIGEKQRLQFARALYHCSRGYTLFIIIYTVPLSL